MENYAQKLTMESLERMLRTIQEGYKPISLKPTWIWAPPGHMRVALRIVGWLKGPIRKTKSMRARKRALYWRLPKE